MFGGTAAAVEGVAAVYGPDQFGQLGQPTPDVDPRAPDLWVTAKITAIQQATRQTVDSNASIQGTVEEVQTSADRIREAMELQAQTVTMITAAVDETALAADSMSSTIAAIRSDTENVAKDIDQVEQGFGHFSEQISNFKASAKAFVNGMAA